MSITHVVFHTMLFMHVFLLLSLQNKLKKIKEKYKDQDEEDRELMMQLLGVNKNDCSTLNMLSVAMMPLNGTQFSILTTVFLP